MIPSTLSRTPPWPGNNLPVSFILAFRLRYETNRSPDWLIKEISKQNKMLFTLNSKSKKPKLENNIKGIMDDTNEPIDPDMVFFGLIFVNFIPPMLLPNTYPPISVKKHIQII